MTGRPPKPPEMRKKPKPCIKVYFETDADKALVMDTIQYDVSAWAAKLLLWEARRVRDVRRIKGIRQP